MRKIEIVLANDIHARKKTLEKNCMKLWADIVKKRAKNRCEKCGRSDTLNSHHIYSRSNKAVRFDIDNGACLCAGHHTLNSIFSAHKTPFEFTEWITAKRGNEWRARLQQKANSYFKQDLFFELKYLEQELKKLQ